MAVHLPGQRMRRRQRSRANSRRATQRRRRPIVDRAKAVGIALYR